jgi:hypothetical protein
MTRRARITLHRAFDEARFGQARTLDLRASLPTAAEAIRRAEPWLRDRQVAKAGEVLVITGRGKGSFGGVPVVREAVRRLLGTLKRKGVVSGVSEHTAGSFVVALAPVRALFEAPPRSSRRGPPPAPLDPQGVQGLDAATRADLRRLAERWLEMLGAPLTAAFVRDEMLRQFSVLAGAIPPGTTDREQRLRTLIAATLDELAGMR